MMHRINPQERCINPQELTEKNVALWYNIFRTQLFVESGSLYPKFI